jgi:5'-deoxynucleotidase YfbR-like HD superfamily hydrolase
MARWNGQTCGNHALSVAQHCLLVEEILGVLYADAPRTWRMAALLHDSPEYVIGDLISPFKAAIGDDYKTLEKKLLEVIHMSFDLPAVLPLPVVKIIKQADKLAAYFEAIAVAGFDMDEAEKYFGGSDSVKDTDMERFFAIIPMPAPEAQRRFMDRFNELSS